jgi:hypothetical protein
MKTLHKTLTIAFLAVSIFISGLTVDFVGAQNTVASTAATQKPAEVTAPELTPSEIPPSKYHFRDRL